MAKNRIGFGSDFVLTDQQVGIGTTFPTAKLQVVGGIKGNFNISGVTTLTSYGGFVSQKQFVNENLTLTGEYNTLSEDIIVGLGKTFTISSGSSVSIGTLENVSIGTHFSVPNGGTSARTDSPVEGMVRFNDDLNTLEFYNGFEWRQFTVTGASGRGVFGENTANHIMDFVNIQSLGNALNFGTLSNSRASAYACASSTRGLWGGGSISPSNSNVIDYITIASEGNAIDFGDLLADIGTELTSCSSSTRGIWAGGYGLPGRINVIQYVSISTLGNALDFGDLTSLGVAIGSFASTTRGVFGGGYRTSPGTGSDIDFITISSTGNSINFGDLTVSRGRLSGCSNSVRGIFASGRGYPNAILSNIIEYITIASSGNAIFFGDLSTSNRNMLASASSSTRAIFAGGYSPSNSNVIDYVTIASTGNAQDFGDLTKEKRGVSGLSDSHGGLGGF